MGTCGSRGSHSAPKSRAAAERTRGQRTAENRSSPAGLRRQAVADVGRPLRTSTRKPMPFVNPLIDRWSRGEPVLSAWVSSGEPLIASFLAACGYDEVLVDLQHGAVEIGDLSDVFAAI